MKADFIHFNSTPGEKLNAGSVKLDDCSHDFVYPDGYTPVENSLLGRPGGTSAVSVVINNSDGREYAIKTPHRDMLFGMGEGRSLSWNLAQSAEIFASMCLADFKGDARIARIHKAGENYIIKDKFDNLRPFNDFSFSADVLRSICRQLAEYLCFIHFPSGDKGPLLADYAARIKHSPEAKNPNCCAEGFYCILDMHLETMDPGSVKALAEILDFEETNPCVSHNDWDPVNIKVSPDDKACLYDFGTTKLGGRLYDITEFCEDQSHHVKRLTLHNYIDIYNEKYKGRAV
ncbi:MAG: hypothetical protein FWD15_00800 [Alphaproteobacteria bacterium]|nr:hypothetical protein [Alphaproteobacteria bacterium]